MVRTGILEAWDLQGRAVSEPADPDSVGKLSVGECSQGQLLRGPRGHHLVAGTVLAGIRWWSDPKRPMMRSPQRPWPPEVILEGPALDLRVGDGN